MILADVGGQVYAQAEGVATLSFAPLADRAAFLTGLNVSNESAADNWTVSVGSRELFRFRHLSGANGFQRPFHRVFNGLSTRLDFFEYCRNVLGVDARIPIPNGQAITVASVGGATADIDFILQEVDNPSANVRGFNHYMGSEFIMPLAWFLNATQSAAGAVQVDTQVSPQYVPNIFNSVGLPTDWRIELLALFLEGMGVNTFSGAANHQSTTRDVRMTRNGTILFTRGGLGIPNKGSDSAAGSANTVFGQRSAIYPPFEQCLSTDDNVLSPSITLKGGDALQIFTDLNGDLTGGASYANDLILAIARVTVPGGQ